MRTRIKMKVILTLMLEPQAKSPKNEAKSERPKIVENQVRKRRKGRPTVTYLTTKAVKPLRKKRIIRQRPSQKRPQRNRRNRLPPRLQPQPPMMKHLQLKRFARISASTMSTWSILRPIIKT